MRMGLAIFALMAPVAPSIVRSAPAGTTSDSTRATPAAGAWLAVRTDSNAPMAIDHFELLWEQRREALRAGANGGAEAEAKAKANANANAILETMVVDKLRSGWPNFFAYADALVHQSRRALKNGSRASASEAVRLAEAAVALAPARPGAHLALAAARFRADARDAFGAVRDVYAALRLMVVEPPLLRARLGNLLLVAMLSLFVASFAWVVFTAWRYVGVLSHDLRHFIASRPNHAQARLLAVTLLVLPVLVRLPPAWAALVWLVAVGRYLIRDELRVAVVIGVYFMFAPLLLRPATEHIGYGGTRAEDLYLAGRDAGAVDAERRLAAEPNPPPEALFVLGMRAHWAGADDRALEVLQSSVRAGGRSAELYIAIGNLHLQRGDMTAAAREYEQALAVAPNDVTALFNLSRVYFATNNQQRAHTLRKRANEIDVDRVERFAASLERPNAPVAIGAELPRWLLRVRRDEAAGSRLPHGGYAMALDQIWRFFAGDGQRLHFMGGATAALCLLLVLWGTRRGIPAPAICARCGAPACKICAEDLPDLHECGDCHRTSMGVRGTTPEMRIRKAIEAHRFSARATRMRRILPIFVVGSGQMLRGEAVLGWSLLAGAVGASLLWAMGADIMAEPGAPWTDFGAPVAWMAAPLAVGIYLFSVWDTLRRER